MEMGNHTNEMLLLFVLVDGETIMPALQDAVHPTDEHRLTQTG